MQRLQVDVGRLLRCGIKLYGECANAAAPMAMATNHDFTLAIQRRSRFCSATDPAVSSAAQTATRSMPGPPVGAEATDPRPVSTSTFHHRTSRPSPLMTAMPRTFCEAIATRYRVSAISAAARTVDTDATDTRCGAFVDESTPAPNSNRRTTTTITAIWNADGTAHRGKNRIPTSRGGGAATYRTSRKEPLSYAPFP